MSKTAVPLLTIQAPLCYDNFILYRKRDDEDVTGMGLFTESPADDESGAGTARQYHFNERRL